MENLGAMEPEQLLQLLSGSIGCAFVILLFIIGYFFISRRGGNKEMRRGTGMGSSTWGASTYLDISPRPELTGSRSPLFQGEPPGLAEDQGGVSVDVSARLAGTGREAWLEEALSMHQASPAPGKSSAYHGREVLRLMREPGTGQISIQVAGMRYRSLNNIRDRAVGERVLAAITHALRFSNGQVASDHGVIGLTLPACDAVELPIPFVALSEAREPDELIRLMSDPDRGHFCIHLADRCYSRLIEVEDPVTRQYILEALTRLLQFSNGLLAANDGVGLVSLPPLSPDVHTPLPAMPQPGKEIPASTVSPLSKPVESPASGSPPASAEALPSEQERFLRQLMSQVTPVSSTIERPSLMGSIRRMRSKTSDDLLPPLNLAGEIDRIFQGKLMASAMSGTDAKIEENRDGGVRIRVGRGYYDSPDEVPDPELRSLLKLAIAEWERS